MAILIQNQKVIGSLTNKTFHTDFYRISSQKDEQQNDMSTALIK